MNKHVSLILPTCAVVIVSRCSVDFWNVRQLRCKLKIFPHNSDFSRIFAKNRPVQLLSARMQGYARQICHVCKTSYTAVKILKLACCFVVKIGVI